MPQPTTRPASQLLMRAIRQQMEAHQRALQEIINMAVADDPTLKDAVLDGDAGVWTFPDSPPDK